MSFDLFLLIQLTSSLLVDVSGGGLFYNAALSLFGIYASQSKNPRALLLTSLLLGFTIILDIIYLAVFSINAAVATFGSFTIISKAAALAFSIRVVRGAGLDYSLPSLKLLASNDAEVPPAQAQGNFVGSDSVGTVSSSAGPETPVAVIDSGAFSYQSA